MYKIVWWDSYGIARESALMDKATAEIALANMHPSQDAQIMFVWMR